MQIFLRKIYFHIKNGTHFILEKFIYPRSQDEDLKRREFILNILLGGSVFLSFVAVGNLLFNFLILGAAYRGINPIIATAIFLFFCFLLFLSRHGYFILASHLFLAIYLPPIIYTAYKWGISVPQTILAFGLMIIMAGILIGARFAFVITFFISGIILFLEYLHINSIVIPNLYWQKELYGFDDAITFIATFFVIALVSWLSNREMEKSLNRARQSEVELQKERDLLEVRVRERTEELKRLEIEKLSQLYRFIEFGRLAGGVFHDVINKLTAVSLNVEHLKKTQNKKDMKIDLKQLFIASEKLEDFLLAARKQIQNKEENKLFSLNKEIDDIAQVFDYKVKKANVELRFDAVEDVKVYGSAFKFNQSVANLISNAVDSYLDIGQCKKSERRVAVDLFKNDNYINIKVQDWGCGISKENIDKIFEPFFTTKDSQIGSGIGLASAREIIEKNFNGKIIVESQEGNGSIFTISIPIIPEE